MNSAMKRLMSSLLTARQGQFLIPSAATAFSSGELPAQDCEVHGKAANFEVGLTNSARVKAKLQYQLVLIPQLPHLGGIPFP